MYARIKLACFSGQRQSSETSRDKALEHPAAGFDQDDRKRSSSERRM